MSQSVAGRLRRSATSLSFHTAVSDEFMAGLQSKLEGVGICLSNITWVNFIPDGKREFRRHMIVRAIVQGDGNMKVVRRVRIDLGLNILEQVDS